MISPPSLAVYICDQGRAKNGALQVSQTNLWKLPRLDIDLPIYRAGEGDILRNRGHEIACAQAAEEHRFSKDAGKANELRTRYPIMSAWMVQPVSILKLPWKSLGIVTPFP